MPRTPARPPAFKTIISGILLLLLSACMSVQLVADYDETIDASATELQHKLSEFFVALQSAEPDGRRFRANQEFYKSAAADIDALQVRAAAVRKNEITGEQLQLVEDNLAWLALLHKGCTAGQLTPEQREAIRANGVDASLHCRVSFGAVSNLDDRGDNSLNPALLTNVKGQFEQALGAIIALEVAKKRGSKGKE